MLKRCFYSLLLALLCVLGVTASAQIEVEGEQFSAMAGRRGNVVANAGASGGSYLDILYIPTADAYTEVYYTVTAEQAGWYRFSVIGSTPNDVWTSPFFVTVNDGESIDAKVMGKIAELPAPFSPVAKTIDFGCVYLKQGKNRIKFFVNAKREQDGYLLLYLDKLTFSEPVYGVQTVILNQESAEIPEGRVARFTVVTSYPDTAAHRLAFSVIDSSEQTIANEVLTIAPNSNRYPLNLGVLPCGTYQLVLCDEAGTELFRTAFSVASDEKQESFASDLVRKIKTAVQAVGTQLCGAEENGGGI